MDKPVICIAVHNETRKLRGFTTMMASLHSAQNADSFDVIMCIEPGCPKITKYINMYRVYFKSVTTIIHPIKFGKYNTILHTISEGFNVSDSIIVLDDNTILTPDALVYFEITLECFQDDKFIKIISGNGNDGRLKDKSRYEISISENCSTEKCWATWKDRWEEIKNDFRSFLNNKTIEGVLPLNPRSETIGNALDFTLKESEFVLL